MCKASAKTAKRNKQNGKRDNQSSDRDQDFDLTIPARPHFSTRRGYFTSRFHIEIGLHFSLGQVIAARQRQLTLVTFVPVSLCLLLSYVNTHLGESVMGDRRSLNGLRPYRSAATAVPRRQSPPKPQGARERGRQITTTDIFVQILIRD